MIVVSARTCPPEILARTRNANSAYNRAAKAGWRVLATFAVGGDEDAVVQSIVLRLGNAEQQMSARWSGPPGQGALNFDGAWTTVHPTRGMKSLTWTEFSWAIDGDGEKPLTAAQEKALAVDQQELLDAMATARHLLDARPVTVIPQGSKGNWCSGTVMREGGGLPAMKLKCINPAADGDNLCPGPCRASVEG